MAYGIGTPERSCRGQELHHVQIVQRGSAHGIENPGYDSPQVSKQKANKLSVVSWPSPSINSTDPVICEGISTPIRSRAANKETDPATSSMVSCSYRYCLLILFTGVFPGGKSILRGWGRRWHGTTHLGKLLQWQTESPQLICIYT